MFSTKNLIQLGLVIAALAVFVPRSVAQTVSCSSDDGKRHYCSTNSPGRVRMVQQRSESPCREGYSWGQDDRGVWVDHGCRADFAVDERRHDDHYRPAMATVEVMDRWFPAHPMTCTGTTARQTRVAECA